MRLHGEMIGEVTIFRKVWDDGSVSHSFALSSKGVNNEWYKAYVPCRFKKGVDIPDRSNINVVKSWWTATKGGKLCLFISEYDGLEQVEGFEQVMESLPF